MTGYEPIELRRLMRERLYLFLRTAKVKGVKKITWAELLYKKEKQIVEFITSPYNNVQQAWQNKALDTLKQTEKIEYAKKIQIRTE